MINTWQPSNASSNAIKIDVLQRFAELGQQILQSPIQLNKEVSQEDQALAQAWLKTPENDWQSIIAQLEKEQLFPLAAFFTLAEMQLNGWQCGSTNPAIWIFRWLRSNQLQPAKEQVKQLKKLTDNRYIPYGSVL